MWFFSISFVFSDGPSCHQTRPAAPWGAPDRGYSPAQAFGSQSPAAERRSGPDSGSASRVGLQRLVVPSVPNRARDRVIAAGGAGPPPDRPGRRSDRSTGPGGRAAAPAPGPGAVLRGGRGCLEQPGEGVGRPVHGGAVFPSSPASSSRQDRTVRSNSGRQTAALR